MHKADEQNPETWEIRLSVSHFISSKSSSTYLRRWSGPCSCSLERKATGNRLGWVLPAMLAGKTSCHLYFGNIPWSLLYRLNTCSDINHISYSECKKYCASPQSEGPLTKYQAYLNSFYKGTSLSILWMSPNLGGSDTPNLNPLNVFVGLSRGGHMIALHDCFQRDLHLWSSALKPTCYCYFTGHDKDKGPADRDTHSHCNSIYLGNSLISMLLNVVFELHGWPQYLLYMNTTYQYRACWVCGQKTRTCFV